LGASYGVIGSRFLRPPVMMINHSVSRLCPGLHTTSRTSRKSSEKEGGRMVRVDLPNLVFPPDLGFYEFLEP
jgi:hypothetical protein